MSPQIWKHKKTKKQFRAMPWWEIVDGQEIDHKEIPIPEVNVPWKFGMLVQVGWLIENGHGVWFGISPEAKKQFRVVKSKEPAKL